MLFFLLIGPNSFATGTFRKIVEFPDRSYAPDTLLLCTQPCTMMAWQSVAISAQGSEAVVVFPRPSSVDRRPSLILSNYGTRPFNAGQSRVDRGVGAKLDRAKGDIVDRKVRPL